MDILENRTLPCPKNVSITSKNLEEETCNLMKHVPTV